MQDPFWQSARVILQDRRRLIMAGVGALISAGCFGAGLGMLLPTLHLLLQQQADLGDLIIEAFGGTVQTVSDATDPPGAPAPPLAPAPGGLAGLGHAIAEFVPTDRFGAFVMVMAVIAVLSVVGSTGRYIHELLTITIVFRAGMTWRTRLFRRLVHAPMAQVMQTSNADHISRVMFDVAQMTNGYRAFLGKAVAESLKGAAALGLALLVNWWLTLLALVGAPVLAVLLRKFGKKIRRASREALHQQGRMVGVLNESLGALDVVKVHGAEGYERRRFARVSRMLFTNSMKVRQFRAMSGPVVETLALLGVTGLACVAAWLILRRDVPAEEFMTVLLALGAAAASLKPLTGLHTQIQESRAAADRVLACMELQVEPTGRDKPAAAPPLPRHAHSVVMQGVTYSYPGQREPALRGVSLEAQFGQTVAIVGGNGAGKSTLLSLLPRLITPSSGRLLVDGVDIASVSLSSLRRQLAVVTQRSVLFEGTIAQNIGYGQAKLKMEPIIRAARAAHAHDFIAALPQGYDTPLGEDGAGLSGGQMQRICIARAVLRDPAILILDEATSQIDADSEAEISRALRDFRQGRTTFIIAHRLSTVIDADMIAVMQDGRILDRGTHAELLARCQAYQSLTQNQLRTPDA